MSDIRLRMEFRHSGKWTWILSVGKHEQHARKEIPSAVSHLTTTVPVSTGFDHLNLRLNTWKTRSPRFVTEYFKNTVTTIWDWILEKHGHHDSKLIILKSRRTHDRLNWRLDMIQCQKVFWKKARLFRVIWCNRVWSICFCPRSGPAIFGATVCEVHISVHGKTLWCTCVPPTSQKKNWWKCTGVRCNKGHVCHCCANQGAALDGGKKKNDHFLPLGFQKAIF